MLFNQVIHVILNFDIPRPCEIVGCDLFKLRSTYSFELFQSVSMNLFAPYSSNYSGIIHMLHLNQSCYCYKSTCYGIFNAFDQIYLRSSVIQRRFSEFWNLNQNNQRNVLQFLWMFNNLVLPVRPDYLLLLAEYAHLSGHTYSVLTSFWKRFYVSNLLDSAASILIITSKHFSHAKKFKIALFIHF